MKLNTLDCVLPLVCSVNACELLKVTFVEKKQRVKLGDKYTEWLGSLMGPFIFNIFLNDFYYYWRRNVMFLTILTMQVFYTNIEIMILLVMICYQRLAQ